MRRNLARTCALGRMDAHPVPPRSKVVRIRFGCQRYDDASDRALRRCDPGNPGVQRKRTERLVNLALVNVFAIFAWELGIDVWEVVRGGSAKPFDFVPFCYGPGADGHCLPIDPA